MFKTKNKIFHTEERKVRKRDLGICEVSGGRLAKWENLVYENRS